MAAQATLAGLVGVRIPAPQLAIPSEPERMFVSWDEGFGSRRTKRGPRWQHRSPTARRCDGSDCARPAGPRDTEKVRRSVEHLRRAFRPVCVAASGRAARNTSTPAEGDPRRALDLQPGPFEGASVSRRRQGPDMRIVRPRRDLERQPHVVDPRPHQRRRRRPPLGESPHRLPQLRRDVRHALRPSEPMGTRLRPVRRHLPAQGKCATSLLIGVRTSRAEQARTSSRHA